MELRIEEMGYRVDRRRLTFAGKEKPSRIFCFQIDGRGRYDPRVSSREVPAARTEAQLLCECPANVRDTLRRRGDPVIGHRPQQRHARLKSVDALRSRAAPAYVEAIRVMQELRAR